MMDRHGGFALDEAVARPGRGIMTAKGGRQRWRGVATGLLGLLSPAAILVALAIAGAVPAAAQEFPEVPLYELLPPNYPYPLARVCYTQEGICDIPTYVFPGAPCECRRADGVWISGVVTH